MADNIAGGGNAGGVSAAAPLGPILPFGKIKDASQLRIACVYNGRLFHVALTEILAELNGNRAGKSGKDGG